MGFDVEAMRRGFPALEAGLVHFDGPGGTQTPRTVADAVAGALVAATSQSGRHTSAERHATAIVTGARRAVADLLGADPQGVVFGRSATNLTFDFARTISQEWVPGDEVVVCPLDHGANIRPWQFAADRSGATLRWIDFDPRTGEVETGSVAEIVSERTRLVAMTGASNLTGARPPITQIGALVHAVDALFYVDGVHLTPHAPVDVEELGADFYVMSLHKVFGPHCAAVVARPALLERFAPEKLAATSDEVPARFELGTMPYELLAGVTATVDYVADLCSREDVDRRACVLTTMASIERHETRLRARLERGLDQIPGLVVHSRAAQRTPTLLLEVEGHASTEVQRLLANRGIVAPSGAFNAVAASRVLGLGDDGGVRIGIAAYTTEGEVDHLLAGLEACVRRPAPVIVL